MEPRHWAIPMRISPDWLFFDADQFVLKLLVQGLDTLDILVISLTCEGKLERGGGVVKQFDAQVVLQAAEVFAQRGLERNRASAARVRPPLSTMARKYS